MQFKEIIDRGKQLITNANVEWEKIKNENHIREFLVFSFAMPVFAAISAAYFIGALIWSPELFHKGIAYVVVDIVLRFGIHLVVLYAVVYLTGFLNAGFGVIADQNKTFIYVLYSLVPVYGAFILAGLLPGMAELFILIGFLSLYLFWTGAKILMDVSQDKCFPYVVSIVVTYLLTHKVFYEIFKKVMTLIASATSPIL